jgi:ParB family chromosome partitioning protein
MANAPETDTLAPRSEETATAGLDVLPANLLVPLPDEEIVPAAAEPSSAAEAVKTRRNEAAARPAPARPRGPRLERVPTSAIQPLATMPQQRLEPADLRALAASIKRHGMALPLLVRLDQKRPGTFELFVGYRRWRAALMAKIPQVPVIIFDALDESVAVEIGILENLHRRDLTVVEEAERFRILADRHGRTPDQIAALSAAIRNYGDVLGNEVQAARGRGVWWNLESRR